MKIKSFRHIYYFSFGVVASLVLYFWFLYSDYYPNFQAWVQIHTAWYGLILVLVKVFGIVWPPMTGGIWTFASIPLLGWKLAYIFDFIGTIIGSVIAYWIARKWGMAWMSKIFDDVTLKKIKQLRVKPGKEFEAVFFLRLFGGSIVEVICYGAGLLGVRFKTYLLASTMSHMALVIPIYYFTGELISGKRIAINTGLILCFAIVFIFFRKRYFHFDET